MSLALNESVMVGSRGDRVERLVRWDVSIGERVERASSTATLSPYSITTRGSGFAQTRHTGRGTSMHSSSQPVAAAAELLERRGGLCG